MDADNEKLRTIFFSSFFLFNFYFNFNQKKFTALQFIWFLLFLDVFPVPMNVETFFLSFSFFKFYWVVWIVCFFFAYSVGIASELFLLGVVGFCLFHSGTYKCCYYLDAPYFTTLWYHWNIYQTIMFDFFICFRNYLDCVAAKAVAVQFGSFVSFHLKHKFKYIRKT